MSLFSWFNNKPQKSEYLNAEKILKIFTGYQPAFTNWNGCIYESELVRSAVDARARHISKLKVEIVGAAQPQLQARLRRAPNSLQTWSQFLYRTSAILDINNTCFIVPVLGQYNDVVGYIPINPISCQLVPDEKGNIWLRYQFSNGQLGAIEWERVCVLTKHQYRNDFFGDSNKALNETMQLIHMQNQGIEEGVKNASTFRFMAKLTNFSKSEDLKKEQQRFTENHLATSDGNGGLLLFPNTYDSIQQITSKPFTVDADQMKLIQTNVYNYFGVNEKVLQGAAYGDEFSAYYESSIEPFAIQFSEGMTKLVFSDREQAQGNKIIATSNRLQFMTNKDKMEVSSQMLDRGIFTLNEVRDIWNLPRVEGGDIRIIRGEYYDADEKVGSAEIEIEPEEGNDAGEKFSNEKGNNNAN